MECFFAYLVFNSFRLRKVSNDRFTRRSLALKKIFPKWFTIGDYGITLDCISDRALDYVVGLISPPITHYYIKHDVLHQSGSHAFRNNFCCSFYPTHTRWQPWPPLIGIHRKKKLSVTSLYVEYIVDNSISVWRDLTITMNPVTPVAESSRLFCLYTCRKLLWLLIFMNARVFFIYVRLHCCIYASWLVT